MNIEIPSAGPVEIESTNEKTAYAEDKEDDASLSFDNSKEWISWNAVWKFLLLISIIFLRILFLKI